jgi:hypothetical protein
MIFKGVASDSPTTFAAGRRDDEGMKTKGGGKQNKKNTIFVPATSRLPWREYRASLVRGETPLHLRRASRESGVWCHEIPFLEPGCLLIESPSRSFDDQRYVQHSPRLPSQCIFHGAFI